MHLNFPSTIGTIPHMSPPLFPEQRAQMQQPAPAYDWATAEQISRMAAASVAPATPAPTTYEDAYTDDADPDTDTLGGQMQYVYFEMPQPSAPSAPSAPSMSISVGNERTPLLSASGPVTVSVGEPVTTTTATTSVGGLSVTASTTASTTATASVSIGAGAPMSMFAAPCIVMDIPADDK